MQLNQIPHFQSRILFSNLVTESNANARTPWKPMNHMPILAHPENPSIQFFIKILQTYFLGPILTNIVNLTLSGGIFYRHPNKLLSSLSFKNPPLSTDPLIHLYPLMISTTFVQFQTSTSFPECSKRPPTFNLTCPLTRCFFQSAYRIFHSSETTLLKIHNDLILAMDRGEVTCILLDLLAAFDTVDHSILLDHPSSQLVRFWWYFTILLNWSSSYLSSCSPDSLNQWFHLCIFYFFPGVYLKVPSLAHCLFYSRYYSSWFDDLKKLPQYTLYHLYADDTQLYSVHSFTPMLFLICCLEYSLFCADGTLNPIHSLTHSLLTILVPPLTVTCISLIKSTLYLNLVIFTFVTFVEFVIFFLSSVATALANSLVSSKLDHCNSLYFGISQVNLNKLQRIQNPLASVIVNTSKYQYISHHYLKNYTGSQSNKESITKSVFSHTKHSQINNLHNFTIVFHFRQILFLQDLLIHSFFPFYLTDHHLTKRLSLSLVHDSGIHSLLIPETGLLCQYSVPSSKHTFLKLRSLLRLFPISLDCLPAFWFLIFLYFMPYRLTPSETSSDANIAQVDYVPPWLREFRDQSIDNSFGFDWGHGCKC